MALLRNRMALHVPAACCSKRRSSQSATTPACRASRVLSAHFIDAAARPTLRSVMRIRSNAVPGLLSPRSTRPGVRALASAAGISGQGSSKGGAEGPSSAGGTEGPSSAGGTEGKTLLASLLMGIQWLRQWLLAPFVKLYDVITSIPALAASRRLKELREAAEAAPDDTAAQLAYLAELNHKFPEKVVEHMQSSKYACSTPIVMEYIKALVKSGKLDDYGGDISEAGMTEGEVARLARAPEHRSLPTLLQQLCDAARGKQADLSPGDSARRPLHVIVNGRAIGVPDNGPMGIFQRILSTAVVVMCLSVFWLVGVGVARRYGAMASGNAAMGNGVAPATGTNSHAPKEYNKNSLPEKSVKTFKDVYGCDEAKAELEEIVEYLKTPDKFTRLGGKLPKGVLLTGPPGTGKTLLARAVAGEAGVPFFYRAGSEFEEMFVGVGSRRVRSLFAAAKKKAPCIVFVDEIDAIGGNRKQWESHTRKTLNQMLVEMDGFESNEGVIVMAATNLPETLDPALTRPGRFDRHIAVPLPDISGRLQILEHYMKDKPMSPEVDKQTLARNTPGFSGAKLSNLVNEASLIAAKTNKDLITPAMLEEARDKILMGVERKSLVQSDEARKLTAYHEGGHALVAMQTQGANPIHKATIVPRGHALGMVTQLPDKDEFSITKEQMLARIDVCMGGKVAEEIIFGENKVTSGARNDLMQATRLARHMVADCGMSNEIGPVHVESMADSSRVGSSEIWRHVDLEVQRILREAYARVKTLLTTNEKQLHDLANALIQHETLDQKDIRAVLDGTFRASEPPATSSAAKPPRGDQKLHDQKDVGVGGGDEPIPAGAASASTPAE